MIAFALALQLSAASPLSREIDCPILEIGLSPSTLDALAKSVDQPNADAAVTAKAELRKAITQCGELHRWSKNKAAASAYFFTGKIESNRAKTMLAPFGISYDLFDNYYSTLTPDQKLAAVRGETPAMRDMIRMLATNGFLIHGWPDDKIRQLGRAAGAVFNARWYMEEAVVSFEGDGLFRSPLKVGP